MGIGQLAALTAAALWACSSLFYSRTKLSAWQINFGKNFLASLLLCSHLAVTVWFSDRPMFTADRNTWGLLAISSLTGIVIGDTFYFRSLQILGARQALIVSMTSPLFATVIGWLALNEQLSMLSLFGILLTTVGIVVVVSERGGAGAVPGYFPAPMSHGIAAGLGGAVCNAIGGTFSRLGTHGSELLNASGCDALEATVIRVGAASAFSILLVLLSGKLVRTAKACFEPATLRTYLPAVICGPWLGIWMSQIAYKYSYLAIALTLTCTTPLFVMPILRIVYGHRITMRALLGACTALTGIYLTVPR